MLRHNQDYFPENAQQPEAVLFAPCPKWVEPPEHLRAQTRGADTAEIRMSAPQGCEEIRQASHRAHE